MVDEKVLYYLEYFNVLIIQVQQPQITRKVDNKIFVCFYILILHIFLKAIKTNLNKQTN